MNCQRARWVNGEWVKMEDSEKKAIVGILVGRVCPKRENQQFPPVVKEGLLALEALLERDLPESLKHVGIFGFLLGQGMAR